LNTENADQESDDLINTQKSSFNPQLESPRGNPETFQGQLHIIEKREEGEEEEKKAEPSPS